MSQGDTHGTHKHVPLEKARAGETSGHVRIVLVVSTLLAIVVLGVVLFVYSGGA